MPEPVKRIYWDSNVFLSYVNGNPSHLPTLDALLDSSSNGDIEIVTSTISITEVAFAQYEQTRQALDPSVEALIDQLWSDRQAVTLVEFYELIGREARSTMRLAIAKGWSLKPFDAIHLATAKRMQVSEFHTYDQRLHKFSDDLGLFIREAFTSSPRLLP